MSLTKVGTLFDATAAAPPGLWGGFGAEGVVR